MSIVTIRNVEFLNNPAKFTDSYNFRVTFECLSPLPDDLEWKLIYVSEPSNSALDQELDSCLVGPVPPGVNVFEFSSPAPDISRIPQGELLGVAALILTGSYLDQEFVRVGYYQNTEMEGLEGQGGADAEGSEGTPAAPANVLPPGTKIEVDKLVRDITTKPRVTRFQIRWDVAPPQAQSSAGAATSAAVPSADSYGDGDDGETDDKDDSDKMNVDSNGL